MKKHIFILLIIIVNSVSAQEKWTLQQCLDYASKHSPDIQQSFWEININEREKKAAYGKLFPSVNTNISHSYSLGSTINPNNNAREALNVQYDQIYAQANIDLFNWKNYLNIGLSRLKKESAEYRYQTVKNDLKFSIINLFFQYQKSKSWFNVLAPQVNGMKEQIVRTEKEVEIGNRAKSDIYDIKANFGTIQEQWISAQNEMNIAKISLLAALNINKDSLDFVLDKNNLPDIIAISNDDFISNIVEKNPIYKASLKDLEVSQQNVKLAKASYLPNISGQYQWSSFYSAILNGSNGNSFSNQFNQNKNQQIYFGVNIPIFQQFQVKNNVEIAQINKINTELVNQKKITELYKTLYIIVEQYSNAAEKNKLLQENFENQRLSFERSEEKYKEGFMDAYTFFLVRNNWLQANFNLINSEYELQQQYALLKIFTD